MHNANINIHQVLMAFQYTPSTSFIQQTKRQPHYHDIAIPNPLDREEK